MIYPLLLISSLLLLLIFPYAHGESSFTGSSCSLSNYTNGSPFESNLQKLHSILPQKAVQNAGSYNASFGTGKTRVYGVAMCFADSSEDACNDCLAEAPSGITKACPANKTADIMYDSCIFRYSDQEISDTGMLSCVPHLTDTELDKLTDPQKFKNISQQLMTDLKVKASLSPLRLATGVVTYTSKQSIYGLVQCARNLEHEQCEKCIEEAWDFAGNCSDVTLRGAGVITMSCYLRYEFHPFYVISQAQPPWKTNGGEGKHKMAQKCLFVMLEIIAALLFL